MDSEEKIKIWRYEIIEAIEDILDPGKITEKDNLTALALFRLMEIFYREQGEEGFENIERIWHYIKDQYKD